MTTSTQEPGGRRFTRRALLIGGGVTAAGLAAGTWVTACTDDPEDSPSSSPTTPPETIAPSTARVSEIIALGRRYIEIDPEATSTDALERALPDRARALRRPAEIEAALNEQAEVVQREFREQAVVVIDGWRMSRTEANLAALAASMSR